MKLHENKELFEQAILATSQRYNIPEIFIEKDYWVTVLLHKIFHSDLSGQVVFKGGTALSKCHKLISRFSEDVDLVIFQEKDETPNQSKKKLRTISKLAEEVLPEIQIDGLTNKMGNIRKTAHAYEKVYSGSFGQVREHVILEVTWLGNSEPFIQSTVDSYVYQMMVDTDQMDLAEEYDVAPFQVQVLSAERTFCEKVMSLVRFSFTENPIEDLQNKIRHIYDLHEMLKSNAVRDFVFSDAFGDMLIKVGKDDVVSFKNNNSWLAHHPSQAMIFSKPQETWDKIKTIYHTSFKDLVIEDLPEEETIVAVLKAINQRFSIVNWDVLS